MSEQIFYTEIQCLSLTEFGPSRLNSCRYNYIDFSDCPVGFRAMAMRNKSILSQLPDTVSELTTMQYYNRLFLYYAAEFSADV